MSDNWLNDAIQFPRLIAELMAAGVENDESMMQAVAESMDLEPFELGALFERAQQVWDGIVAVTPGGPFPQIVKRIEVIHGRDPDEGCEHSIYVNGIEVTAEVYDVDPGRGHLRSDWDESTEASCATASPAVAAELRQLRDTIAENSQYIEEGR